MRRTALVLAAVFSAVRPAAAAVTEVHYVMGTYFRITAEGGDDAHVRRVLGRCFSAARESDARFSRFDAHSELSRLNARADDAAPAAVSPEMAALLRAALRLYTTTNGTFDVSAGALTRLWRTAAAWPSVETIAATRQGSGAGAFDVVGTTLSHRSGVSIDLDGIAKGWAVDRCVTQLRDGGIERAFLSFGESSLYALGAPSGTPGWVVSLRGLNTERALGTLTLCDQAVSVSAVFGHERLVGARRVGHIVDPRTGLPLTSPAMAVVVAESATDAEAFSKALLIDVDSAATAASKQLITGAVMVQPSRATRVGRIAFTPFKTSRPIVAAAEPLR